MRCNAHLLSWRRVDMTQRRLSDTSAWLRLKRCGLRSAASTDLSISATMYSRLLHSSSSCGAPEAEIRLTPCGPTRNALVRAKAGGGSRQIVQSARRAVGSQQYGSAGNQEQCVSGALTAQQKAAARAVSCPCMHRRVVHKTHLCRQLPLVRTAARQALPSAELILHASQLQTAGRWPYEYWNPTAPGGWRQQWR